MMKKKSNDEISELPESLLHHILSFLPYEAVARTSVLSKKWERAWRTYPVLKFDHCTVFREYSLTNWDSDSDSDLDFDKDDLIRRNVLFNRLAETMRNRHCRDMMNVMVSSELRETMPSPLSNLVGLNFVCYNRPTVFTIAKVVDSLLWFAPHTKTISVENDEDEDEFSFEFTYKKQLIYDGEIVSCCKSLPISCWHHCVEAVKVVFKERNNKISYILNGADIWEKIVALCEVWQRMKST